MKSITCGAVAALIVSFPRVSTGQEGPAVELAPEHAPQPAREPPVSLGAGTAGDAELVRGLTEQRFRSASASSSHTSVGGYGEVHVRGVAEGKDADREWVADIPRLVLFVAHEFDERFRAYTELEWEHAIACSSCTGAVELEQAYVDWLIAGDPFGLRAGLILVPMGIINQWHEPPIFHGVARPDVDTVVIPSTWREIGAGIFGQPLDELRYEVYTMTALDPTGFGSNGIAGGRQNGSFARANAWALVGRVEVEPLLGVVIGVGGYYADVGQNGDFFDRDGAEVDLSLPVIGWEADARWRRSGIEWRFVIAEWRLPESEAQMAAFDETGVSVLADRSRPLPTVVRGGYVEGAYDVLHPSGSSHQLLPFARVEAHDTQADVPDGFEPSPLFHVRGATVGLSYRPIQQIVLKTDYQVKNRKLGFDETRVSFGVGFMY